MDKQTRPTLTVESVIRFLGNIVNGGMALAEVFGPGFVLDTIGQATVALIKAYEVETGEILAVDGDGLDDLVRYLSEGVHREHAAWMETQGDVTLPCGHTISEHNEIIGHTEAPEVEVETDDYVPGPHLYL